MALGFDGCVEQFARRMSPGSYLVNSVQSVGGKCGNSGIIIETEKRINNIQAFSSYFKEVV